MSQLSGQPKKILLTIAELLWQTDFEYKNPWGEADENFRFFRDSSIWLGLDFNYNDMEFMAALMTENELLLDSKIKGEISLQDTLSQLEIPKEKKFEIYYDVWGPATLTESYKTNWKSYYSSWAEDSLRFAYREGEWYYYDGSYQGYDTDNFDSDNFEITQVNSLKESKKTTLAKLVVENTNEILDNLDKDTLIELRNIINQKLSS